MVANRKFKASTDFREELAKDFSLLQQHSEADKATAASKKMLLIKLVNQKIIMVARNTQTIGLHLSEINRFKGVMADLQTQVDGGNKEITSLRQKGDERENEIEEQRVKREKATEIEAIAVKISKALLSSTENTLASERNNAEKAKDQHAKEIDCLNQDMIRLTGQQTAFSLGRWIGF
ncbi:hypothetical protein MMC17_003947 [Xylographa soralifera]|nr:hypothetical protein [Xylographa soralifera]